MEPWWISGEPERLNMFLSTYRGRWQCVWKKNEASQDAEKHWVLISVAPKLFTEPWLKAYWALVWQFGTLAAQQRTQRTLPWWWGEHRGVVDGSLPDFDPPRWHAVQLLPGKQYRTIKKRTQGQSLSQSCAGNAPPPLLLLCSRTMTFTDRDLGKNQAALSVHYLLIFNCLDVTDY